MCPVLIPLLVLAVASASYINNKWTRTELINYVSMNKATIKKRQKSSSKNCNIRNQAVKVSAEKEPEQGHTNKIIADEIEWKARSYCVNLTRTESGESEYAGLPARAVRFNWIFHLQRPNRFNAVGIIISISTEATPTHCRTFICLRRKQHTRAMFGTPRASECARFQFNSWLSPKSNVHWANGVCFVHSAFVGRLKIIILEFVMVKLGEHAEFVRALQ